MKIEIRLFLTMQQYLPVGDGELSCKLTVKPQTTISDVLKRLRVPEDQFKGVTVQRQPG